VPDSACHAGGRRPRTDFHEAGDLAREADRVRNRSDRLGAVLLVAAVKDQLRHAGEHGALRTRQLPTETRVLLDDAANRHRSFRDLAEQLEVSSDHVAAGMEKRVRVRDGYLVRGVVALGANWDGDERAVLPGHAFLLRRVNAFKHRATRRA